jgi:hypothetical protein
MGCGGSGVPEDFNIGPALYNAIMDIAYGTNYVSGGESSYTPGGNGNWLTYLMTELPFKITAQLDKLTPGHSTFALSGRAFGEPFIINDDVDVSMDPFDFKDKEPGNTGKK